MIECRHCGRESSNGLALCDLCRRYASDCLEYLPIYFRNLSRQRRPGRPNGSIGSGGDCGDGGSESVIAALGRAENTISTWARVLADDRDVEIPAADTEVELFDRLCAMFEALLPTVATLEWCGQFVRDLARHERGLRAVTEASLPGWYAGQCAQPVAFDEEGAVIRCRTSTHVIPGLTWVHCPGCGAITHARDHLPLILDEAREWTATPRRMAEALSALLDTEPSVPRLHERIRKWEQRGKVATSRRLDGDGDPTGPKRVRLGDVLDLLVNEGQTRTSDKSTKVS